MNVKILYSFLFMVVAIYSCKKDNSPGLGGGPYSFKCWNKMAGAITNFQSNNSKYPEHWDFGDGDTLLVTGGVNSSFGPQNHVYRAPGIYTVTLVVNNDVTRTVVQQDTIQPNFYFTYTGQPIVGDTIYFHFPAFLPAGISYLWTFGDGATSTDSIPYHIYSSNGNFVVKLTINGNPDSPDVYSQLTIYNDPVYTHQMTALRVWHGTDSIFYSNSGTHFFTHPDSSFALAYIDELTIGYSFPGSYTVNFSYSTTTGNTIIFSNTSPSYSGFVSGASLPSTISYNYVTDSMVINLYMSGSPGPGVIVQEYLNWYSP